MTQQYAHEMITQFNMASGKSLNFTGHDVVFDTKAKAQQSAQEIAEMFNIPLTDIPVYEFAEPDWWNE